MTATIPSVKYIFSLKKTWYPQVSARNDGLADAREMAPMTKMQQIQLKFSTIF